MRKQRGFTLIELLVVMATLGIIAAIAVLGVGGFFSTTDNGEPNDTAVTNTSIFEGLAAEPISSLNLTELTFMVDYCLEREVRDPMFETSMFWLARANVYQNQIIINELKERP